MGDGRESVHQLSITAQTLAVRDALLPLGASWKSSRVQLDGITVPAGLFWLGSVVAGHQQRRLSRLAELHCCDVPYRRSGLPCRQLEGSVLRQCQLGAATRMAALAVPPRVAMEVLGHAQFSTTMEVYSHVAPQLQREATDRLAEAIWGSTISTSIAGPP